MIKKYYNTTMPKYTFQLISDVHLEMGTYHVIKPRAPYLLLAGDIGYPESQIYKDFIKRCSKKFEKVFYISGNHEYYQNNKCSQKSIEEIDDYIKDICRQYNNVYYLQNNYYAFDDLLIVGSTLWSDIENSCLSDLSDYSKIYHDKNELLTVNDSTHMFNKNKEYIQSIIETSVKNVLVMTHHLPSYKMILPEFESSPYKSHFASDLEYLFRPPVVAWVCGHAHGFNKQCINNIPCIMNGIGYPSEPRRGASLNFTFDIITDNNAI